MRTPLTGAGIVMSCILAAGAAENPNIEPQAEPNVQTDAGPFAIVESGDPLGLSTQTTESGSFLAAFFTKEELALARSRSDVKLIAPIGDGRWLYRTTDPAVGLTVTRSLPTNFTTEQMLDPAIRGMWRAGLQSLQGSARELVIMPVDRGRASRRRIDAIVRASGGRADLVESDSLLMHAEVTPQGLAALMASGEIMWAEPRAARETDDSLIREFGGANAIEMIEGLTGSGVVLEVVDKGLFTDHVDLLDSSPFVRTLNEGPTDHGTPTYGILFGNGSTQSAARGMMPGQPGIFSSYLDFTDRDAHLASFAGELDGMIQSNSWGSGISRRYNAVSAALDDSIHRHGVLVFQSQSNRGNQDSRPEAWAKNAVSIGGVNGFGTLAREDDRWGGSASTGPAIDGRIKPDLCMFNDGILSTSDTGSAEHVAFTGTSAATPAVAGHAGIMYEMWRTGMFHGGDPAAVSSDRPSVAMARALLINGATPYNFSHAAEDLGRFRQGWGTPDLVNLWAGAPSKWVSDEAFPMVEGDGWSRTFRVHRGTPKLGVTLVWSDPAAMPFATRTLVNDLDLRVISPSGKVYHGNFGLHDRVVSSPGGSPDRVNPIENVFLVEPEAGVWQVDVLAERVAIDALSATPAIDTAFAIVVTGCERPTVSDRVLRVDGTIPDRFRPLSETSIDFELEGVGAQAAGELRVRWGSAIGAFPLEEIAPGRFRADVGGWQCLTDYEFKAVLFGTDGREVTFPADSALGWVPARAVRTVRKNPTQSTGWAASVSGEVSSGQWERGMPVGGGMRLDPAEDADGDGECWLTDNRAGTSGVLGGEVMLRTPIVSIQGLREPVLEYDMWLASEAAGTVGEDGMLVEISYDFGLTWRTLAVERSSFRWQKRRHPLETGHSSATVRFRINSGADGSLVEAGLDAVDFIGIGCPPSGSDIDGNGAVDLSDLNAFVVSFLSQSDLADMNGDGVIDLADLVAFVAGFAGESAI